MELMVWASIVVTVALSLVIWRAIRRDRVGGWRYSLPTLSGLLVLCALMGLTLYGYPFWPHPAILLTMAAVGFVKWGVWNRRQEQHQ